MSTVCAADMESVNTLIKNGEFQAAIKEMRPLAENGNVYAQCELTYQLSIFGNDNHIEEARWAKAAYDSGKANQFCQSRWAELLLLGLGGVKAEPITAARIFEKGASQGLAVSQYYLGSLYLEGNGVLKNEPKGVELIKMAANQDNYPAINRLAEMYQFGFSNVPSIKQDNQLAAKWRLKAVAIIPDSAQYHWLGFLSESGWDDKGKISDPVKAIEKAIDYYQLALSTAKSEGKPPPQPSTYRLGTIYKEGGDGVFPTDNKRACGYFKDSAEEGLTYGMSELAECYENGSGIEKNIKLALKWFSKAAEGGDGFAQYRLAIIYLYGADGVTIDYVEAVKWLRKTSVTNDLYPLGSPFSQYRLGTLYEDGLGVSKDLTQATSWYKKAAEQNQPDAQNKLGAKYAEGNGVQKDMVEALKWFTIATANGNEKAKDNRDKAEKALSKVNVKKAQSLATIWLNNQSKQ